MSFYQINKSQFGEGHDYWTLFNRMPSIISGNTVPIVICDTQGIFTAARIVNNGAGSSVGQLNVIGNAQNYDNSKGKMFTTVIKGVYVTE